MKPFRHALLIAAVCAVPAIAQAATTTVPGTSDPWLAGMPVGSGASGVNASSPPEDFAFTESPVLFLTGLSPGSWLSFAVSVNAAGVVGNCPTTCPPGPTPDGGYFQAHFAGAQNGIADVNAPINSLVGIFLGSSQPDSTGAPSALNFGTIGTSFATLSPELKQVFFIGDGLTGTGTGIGQKFLVPTGATRLYLGTMDGHQWGNNVGAYDVTVGVPEPETYAMLLAGLGLLGAVVRRRKHS